LAHGDRDAFAVSIGNPAAHKAGLLLYVARLAKALGTRNVFSASTLDQMPKQLACGLMYGSWLSIPVPDIARCDLLIVLGANPAASNGSLWTVPDFRGKARAMRARGGRLVTLDPRRSETADLADAHHFLRPGSDVFLLLGMAHTLFAEGRVRLGALAGCVAQLAELEAAVADYSADTVAPRCGLPAETIRQFARDLANTPRAALYGRIGTCTQAYGTLASWLIEVVNILSGHLDTEGGLMFPQAPAFAANTIGRPRVGKGVPLARHRARVSGAPEVYGELPMGCLAEEIETPGAGQVRALFTFASNPVLSAPNGPRLAAALDQLDFMVSVDIYLNETTRHADVILPGRSPLEDGHYDVAFPQFAWRNAARYSPPALASQQLAEWEIVLKLLALVQGGGTDADPLVLDDAIFNADVERQLAPFGEAAVAAAKSALAGRRGPERWVDYALRGGPWGDRFGLAPDGLNLERLIANPDGIDLGPLAPRLPDALRTPDGCIDLAPALLRDDLARVAAALREPVPPLVIIGRRAVRSNNSWMHNLPLLAKGEGRYESRCTLLMHPEDARARGLADGEVARVVSSVGEVRAQLELSDEMMPGVVSLPHGWGHDLPGAQLRVAARRPGANLNALFDENARDPLSGNAILSGVAVDVLPCLAS
jgi:anaerobic selenocysteine-containing dehydrogenase